jgi:anti-anti-sigma factor
MAKLPYDKLTIYEVEELYDLLLDSLKKCDSKLEFDFEGIEKIDMSVIQLLFSFQETCKKEAVDLSLKNFSPELIETLKACGFESVLEVEK